MLSNSDIQKWQTAINGVNESGRQDLSQEEWSALTTLNGSLQTGNFQSEESRQTLALLKNNLSRHNNNRILQAHLRNFVALCEQYITPTPTNRTVRSSGTAANTVNTKKGSNKSLILIIAAIFVGYLIYSNWDTVKEAVGINTTEADTTRIANVKADTTSVDNNKITNNVENIQIQPNVEQNSGQISTSQVNTNANISSSVNNVSYLLSTRLLTEDDLRGMSKQQLRIMRNEIYARHGYIFKSQDLRDYFSAKDWYHPQYSDVSSLLNTIEKRNVTFIQRHE